MARFTARLARSSAFGDYLIAVGLAVAAGVGRAALDLVVPGTAPFILLFPAIVLSGVFCGTGPAVLTAALGGLVVAMPFLDGPMCSWPPFTAAQIDLLLFLPSCAVVLWATARLRRTVRLAAAAEARLQEVFRQIPGAAAILEAPTGRLLLRSSQSDAILGHPERQVLGSGDLDHYGGVHDDGQPYAAGEYPIVRALRDGEIVQGERLMYLRPDRQRVDLEVHAGPVRDPQGKLVAAVGMAFDVTERIAAERQLRASERQHRTVAERLHAAIDAGELGLWEFDLDTQRIRLDASFAGMLGLPPEPTEMPRQELRAMVEPDDRVRSSAVLDGAITDGGIYSDELHMRTAQGTERWFVTRGVVLPETRQIVGVVSDLTDRRQREDALRAALDARDVLMREADHRIKNSLQMVISLLSLQIGRVADPDAKAALAAAITRVEAIANAHLALQRSPDLRGIEVDRMLTDLCGRVGSLNPAITLHCEARTGLTIDADQAIPLGLLASEVLTNALRHAYPTGIDGKVFLTATSRDGSLHLAIADGGAGMPATPKRRGLGSTLIAALGRQIDATLETQSRPGSGTTVSLRMPLPGADAAGQ